jgi:hypothetical protein
MAEARKQPVLGPYMGVIDEILTTDHAVIKRSARELVGPPR